MCYKYVNAVNRYAAEGNKKTKTSPILKGVKAVFTREIHLSRETVQDFVSEASKCDFDVDLGYNRIVVDAKSIMGVFSLDLIIDSVLNYFHARLHSILCIFAEFSIVFLISQS